MPFIYPEENFVLPGGDPPRPARRQAMGTKPWVAPGTLADYRTSWHRPGTWDTYGRPLPSGPTFRMGDLNYSAYTGVDGFYGPNRARERELYREMLAQQREQGLSMRELELENSMLDLNQQRQLDNIMFQNQFRELNFDQDRLREELFRQQHRRPHLSHVYDTTGELGSSGLASPRTLTGNYFPAPYGRSNQLAIEAAPEMWQDGPASFPRMAGLENRLRTPSRLL